MLNSLKNKKIVSLILFLLYLGCMFLLAQNTPRSYIALKASGDIKIDGIADEETWKSAPWTDYFIDIEGTKIPQLKTQAKILWDDSFLYVFAALEEPNVWATLKQRDTVIFYNNDFEVFIDPDGDTHNYYELEINALNTVWDLFLTKPYRNGTKVLDSWDIRDLKSAVAVNGTLNDPSDTDVGWSLEIAIPWAFISENSRNAKPPENSFWRMNFSRVNWNFDLAEGKYSRKKDPAGEFLPEYNWVWSPQGVIAMHEPEKWGYVFFSGESAMSETNFEIPKDEHIKWYMYELYRDLISEDKKKVIWTPANGQLQGQSKTFFGKEIAPVLEYHQAGFSIMVNSPFSQKTMIIKDDGKFISYDKK